MSIVPTTRMTIGLIAAGAVLLVLAANAHLVYVAVTTQPDCVPHSMQADAGQPGGSYRAAKSACSPGARS